MNSLMDIQIQLNHLVIQDPYIHLVFLKDKEFPESLSLFYSSKSSMDPEEYFVAFSDEEEQYSVSYSGRSSEVRKTFSPKQSRDTKKSKILRLIRTICDYSNLKEMAEMEPFLGENELHIDFCNFSLEDVDKAFYRAYSIMHRKSLRSRRKLERCFNQEILYTSSSSSTHA